MDPLFTDDDRDRIAAAVETAEAQTAGEIVPCVVLRSSAYEAVPWRGGVLGALVGAAIIALARTVPLDVLSGLTHDGTAFLLTLGTGLIGAALAATAPPLTRRLISTDRMAEAVHRRAMEAFVEEEVFATRDRTGILLFVSLLEHRIEVLADTGIYQKVDDDVWNGVTERIRTGIESGQLTQGLIDAIEQCGELLEAHGVAPQSDDPDELPGHLRFSDE